MVVACSRFLMLEVCRKNVLFTTSISLGMLVVKEGQMCGERRARSACDAGNAFCNARFSAGYGGFRKKPVCWSMAAAKLIALPEFWSSNNESGNDNVEVTTWKDGDRHRR
jgi:hypothetical protein